jgi:NTE family protein
VRLETGGSVFWGTPGLDEIDLVDAVYSSCALPGIFEPHQRDGFHYMDGGIVDSVPLRFAKIMAPDVTIAVDLTVKATSKTPDYKSRVATTLDRAYDIEEEDAVEHSLHMNVDYNTAYIQTKVGQRVLPSLPATLRLPTERLLEVLSVPVQARDHVSIRIDQTACIGCGLCEMVCETDAFWARGGRAEVRKPANYECTRDHACARNCPTDAIRLGNL